MPLCCIIMQRRNRNVGNMTRLRPSSLLLAALILFSCLYTVARSGPIQGSTAALVVTVGLQVFLPGYVLARALGKTRLMHPVVRLMWVLVCGLSLTIVLGGVARLLNLPVMTYLLVLHGLLLVLAWVAPRPLVDDDAAWRMTWRKLPLYLALLVACLTVWGVSYASRYRFYGFEDQVVFASHAGWLANNPGETPTDTPLRSRQIGSTARDTRFDTDGWTYNHAAWAWTSGVSATQIIWFELGPLFLWAVPLAVFALAYEVTRREEAAAWTAMALALVGLMTLDNIAHYPAYTAFGRLAVFQISTLRQASITLMLPLALLVGFTYLRTFRRHDLVMVLLAGVMLAMMHPFQVTLFVISIGVTVGLRWLMSAQKRAGLLRLLPLVLVLVTLLLLPFVQRLNRSGLRAADSLVEDDRVEAADDVEAQGGFLLLPDLPLIGSTFIRNPAKVFYHPAIVLVALLGLLYGLRLRRGLAAQYIFGTTLVWGMLNFLPGMTELFNQFASSVGLLTTMFLLPVALVLGLSLDDGLRWLAARLKVYAAWPASLVLIGAVALLLFEPIPIPASARDQINTFNEMQQFRRLQPVHVTLAQRLQMRLPSDQTSIVMTPADTASIVIEDLPRTMVTGGRGSGNRARRGDNRFYNQVGYREPWLDSADLDYMTQYGVTHVITRADQTRVAQLMLSPDRFPLLDEAAGHLIFARVATAAPGAIDDLFARMNALYLETPEPRWGPEGFEMPRPGSPEIWGPLVSEWQALRQSAPASDEAQLGLAFTYLMMGADEDALPLWQSLHITYPAVPLFVDALAYTHAALGQPQQGVAVLLAALDSEMPESQVLAARTLLTDTFFHELDGAPLDTVLDVTRTNADVWDYLANFDRPDAVRQRAALLMTQQRWAVASQWLDQLDDIVVSPRDMVAQAVMNLAQGDVAAALDRLRPATDPDWRTAKAYWQPDRWTDNYAEQLYHLLTGDLALRGGQPDAAVAAYQRAVDAGAGLTGQYFLAQALEQAGQQARAEQLRAAVAADWPEGIIELVSMLDIAETRRIFVMQPQIEQNEAEHTLTVTATYGSPQPHAAYPVEAWRIEVISPDAATRYALEDAPAITIDNALVRAAITLTLPDDIPPMTPALVVITPMHSSVVANTSAVVPMVLNRLDSAAVPENATALDLQFGESITLDSYMLDRRTNALDLTLYWQAETPLPEDYQVFVHVVDANGEIITQDDTVPGGYPTSQWRSGVIIADRHTIAVTDLPDTWGILVGLYRLSDFTRLPIMPADARITADSALIYE